LNVRYNNDKSRDYTNPSLPTGESIDPYFSLNGMNNFPLGMGLNSGFGIQGIQAAGFGGGHFLQPTQLGVRSGSSAFIPGSVLLVSNLNEEVWDILSFHFVCVCLQLHAAAARKITTLLPGSVL